MFQYGVEDPYSGYMPPDQYKRALGDLSGSFSGIGAEMAIRNVEDPADLAACTEFTATCRLVVMSPLADSPAERAGLQAGDFVLAVDGETVDGSTMKDQIGQHPRRGRHGRDPYARARRGGAVRRDDHARRDRAAGGRDADDRRPHRLHRAQRVLGARPAEQFAAGLPELLDQGADQIVFDLRDNPGGYIDAAQQIASQFMDPA